MKKITTSEIQTMELGENFVNKLTGGEVVLLIGDLGAGKTTFVKGVALGLGIKKTITSPTFVLMKVYRTRSAKRETRSVKKGKIQNPKMFAEGRISPLAEKLENWKFPPKADSSLSKKVSNLVHIDTYRGLSLGDLESIGVLEYFGRNDTICFVEWGEDLPDYLRKNKIKFYIIKIKHLKEKREFNIKKYGI